MKSSLFVKNFLATAALLLLSFIIFGFSFAFWSYTYINSSQRESMLETADETALTVAAMSSKYSIYSLDMRMSISILSGFSNYDILIADTDGYIICCSDGLSCEHIGMTVPDYAAAGRTFTGISDLSGVYDEMHYVISEPVSSPIDGKAIAYVLVSSVPAQMSQLWRRFSSMMFLVALAVMLLAFVVSFITTKRMVRPIKDMTKTVNEFARGEFASRVVSESDDEIGQLSESFNLMADSLERSETKRREFIANISHELKTPITTISGFADGILDGTIPQEKMNDYLAVISSESHRLSRLVRSMLDMSQLTAKDQAALHSSKFDLLEVLCQTLLSLEGKITDHELDVDAELPEEPIVVFGDKDAITQVIYNLLDNAVKFALPSSVIKLSLYRRSGRAYVSVENHGETIPEEELPYIFDRFHKTDKSRSIDKEGVGLGLYIVKTILDNHREDIFVTSSEGVTKFTFTMTIA